eukprot:TRINITY_DN32426_c0_g1_i1.p1 TRINITY_DN32426_c0_g1~~TRINITY_DN32426_c0_g1_i1.p1  ORF type:complete len:181 (+),score=38.24 TRINITY_DN32426_c0_g1_i1:153-695(+)
MAPRSQEEFPFPAFYHYPPYFTLQPIKDSREKQIQLWKDLILAYCKHQRLYVIELDDCPLFKNAAIDRKLSNEAKEVVLGGLVAEGRAEWPDKSHRNCLILWRRVEDWADVILKFVEENGLNDSVMLVEELRSGDEVRKTELEGLDSLLLYRALKVLEGRGKAQLFRGNTADDEGVKFFL